MRLIAVWEWLVAHMRKLAAPIPEDTYDWDNDPDGRVW